MENTQELIARLNQSGKKLSKSHRRIAECIVQHYDKAAFMTASKLGQYVGVSESTVVRFAAALGYEGYPQLQKALQELIRHRLTASQRFEMTSDMDHSQVLAKVLKADMQNIRATMDEIDIHVFEAAIDKILQARHIYVLGLRASAPLAQFLSHYLKYIFPNVTLVTSGISDVFEQIMRINDEDLLIGISFPRYTSRTLEAMELAKNRGASLARHHRWAAFPAAFRGGSVPDGQERHGFVCGFAVRAAFADQCVDRGFGPAQAAAGGAVFRPVGRHLVGI